MLQFFLYDVFIVVYECICFFLFQFCFICKNKAYLSKRIQKNYFKFSFSVGCCWCYQKLQELTGFDNFLFFIFFVSLFLFLFLFFWGENKFVQFKQNCPYMFPQSSPDRVKHLNSPDRRWISVKAQQKFVKAFCLCTEDASSFTVPNQAQMSSSVDFLLNHELNH